MRIEAVKVLAKVSLIILLYVIVYYFLAGLVSKPFEGDSLQYHIPTAKAILEGKVFSYPKPNLYGSYYPAAAETILSFFILLHIPLNLFNVLAIVLLFFTCLSLGLAYGLKKVTA